MLIRSDCIEKRLFQEWVCLVQFIRQEWLVLSTVHMARVLMETINAGAATLFNSMALTSNNHFHVYVCTYVTIYIHKEQNSFSHQQHDLNRKQDRVST